MVTGIRKMVPIEVVEKVLEKYKDPKRREVIKDLRNLPVRQPKPPAPEGGISLRNASRKYNIPKSSLSIWLRRGHLDILLRTKNEVYLNESQIKVIARLHDKHRGKGKKGLAIFFAGV